MGVLECFGTKFDCNLRRAQSSRRPNGCCLLFVLVGLWIGGNVFLFVILLLTVYVDCWVEFHVGVAMLGRNVRMHAG